MPTPVTPAPGPPGEPAPPRVLFRIGGYRVTWRALVNMTVVVAALSLAWAFWGRVDLADLHARAQSLAPGPVLVAIALLPLAGFPVSWLHLIAGVRFGFLGGLGAVALTSVLHHVLGWAVVKMLPQRWFTRLDPWRHRLTGTGHRDATLLCCLLPGMPYTAQLYLLPLLGTPFPLMFGLSAALHTARAIVTILLGDVSDHLTPGRIASLAVYYAVLFGLSAFAAHRLRSSLPPPPVTSAPQ